MHREPYHFNEETIDKQYDIKLLARFLPFVKPYKLFFLWSILLVVIMTLLDLSLPYVTKIAIDQYIVPHTEAIRKSKGNETAKKTRYLRIDSNDPEVINITRRHPGLFKREKDRMIITYEDLSALSQKEIMVLRRDDLSGVAGIALILISIVFVNFIMTFFQVMIMEYTGQKIMHDLRMILFGHIQNLSISFFNRNPVGRLVTRVTNDIQNMHEMFTSVITFVFKDLFLVIGITLVLFSINVKLALISLTILPVVFYTALKFGSAAREAFRTLRIKLAEINSQFSETIEGVKIVQLFRQEKSNFQAFKKLNHDNYLAGMQQVRVFAVFMPLIEIMGLTAVAIIIYFGGGSVVQGHISLGAFVAFISYMRMFFRPIRDIAEKFNIMQNAMASAERIFLILDKREKLPDPPSKEKLSGLENINSLEFSQVFFSYIKGE
ncbi:MAG: ABC transporter ATP-binding protein, partial [Desulfobacterales bacterium]|nr:ABC transporter ATP-binding protein [Desulfobacterales bacterium]